MKVRPSFVAAINQLADQVENGHLLAAMGGEELLIAAAEKIASMNAGAGQPPGLDQLRDAVDLVEKYAGCGDNSCHFVKPHGAGTNGGCTCIAPGSARPFLSAALANLYKVARKITEAAHD